VTPTEWFYEYVAETPDIRLMPDPGNPETMLTVLVLGQHQEPPQCVASFAHHIETMTAIRSKMQP
jgi:hypothetical protein